MNIETTLAIHAYGTSEGVKKEWDGRGRGHGVVVNGARNKVVEQDGRRVMVAQKVSWGDTHTSVDGGKTWIKTASKQKAFKQTKSEDWNEVSPSEEMAAGCHGANCGRKGRKAGAKPLRSYQTKQESDTLNSKALKVKSRKKARKKY